ncbi:50S ribosomal protein L29 [Halorhodospira halochloris]|uniref:Large ribosomal subunit protein uL29 n=1 Tax=Halorhodospira halochloris TaxID=1052 RepID=A0A0X8XBI9_HALHR|nr:50S ribosomal protein L29 [Halorhodospira halochloris]MBK1652805.1 50S ribosomal protein L29 [Halorhodospira halochloris]MCG5530818.1 50S ribosomal protein L29 [Halorhodospira halochloris]MCG5549253.1 50S ribosomal protein L29 [Halorhodospira halochloris]BAU58926.1 LSU ribosomal protein L29p [Halorhodospira halochloris]
MKASELRNKNMAELEKELIERRKEQFNLRMQKASGQLSRNHQIGLVQRDIARIKTVINERKRAEQRV